MGWMGYLLLPEILTTTQIRILLLLTFTLYTNPSELTLTI